MLLNNKKKEANGFTFIELLIVTALTIIISSSIIPIYGQMNEESQLNEAKAQIMQSLRIAREYSLSGYNNSSYGVFFEISPSVNDRCIIFQGNSYVARNIENDIWVNLGGAITISTNLLNDEVVFSKGKAEPSSSGAVIISNGNNEKEIYINSLGIIGQQ